MNDLTTNILTNTGLNLPKHFTEEQFFEAGRFLANIERGTQWAIGDWYNNIPWGNKQKACESVGLNYATSSQHGVVAAKFQIHTRVNNLSFGHHKAIMQAPDNQLDDLFAQAIQEELSTRQLKDLALGKKNSVAIPETNPAISETDDITIPAQANNNTANEEHNPVVVDDTENETPVVTTTQQSEQSYNATFEANKKLTDLKQANEKLVKKNDELRALNITKNNQIMELESEVMELKRVAALDCAILDDMRAERDKLHNDSGQKPVKVDLEPHSYDGNAKEFKTKLVAVVGRDNNVISAKRKKAYAALDIAPKANGQLKSDADRFAVYEWLASNA